MTSKTRIIWTLKEFTSVLRARQLNQFDCVIGVSGKRGVGKSTLFFKIFNSFKKDGFSQKKHQVYSQKEVINLLGNQEFGFCWDDEAINSGYKRDFQHAGQKTLIKVVTNYRDNFNIYGSALPFFYSLDKDLRELVFCHIHIVERGFAVILLPLSDQIHSQDPWDTKTNIKVEEKENRRMERNPDVSFRYSKLTTFAGYIYFSDMTSKQRRIYQEIKKIKRAKNFGILKDEEELNFIETVYKLLLDNKLTKDGLVQICLREGRKYTGVVSEINRVLKNNGDTRTLTDLWRKGEIKSLHSKSKTGISELVPAPSS